MFAPAKQTIAIQLLSPAAAASIDNNTSFKWHINPRYESSQYTNICAKHLTE